MTENNYPTDEFGRPDGRDYHYKIPFDDSRALRKVRIAEKVKGRWITHESSAKRDGRLDGCEHYQTHDNKGPISGIGEYEYSQQWEYPFGPGRMESLRARPNTAGGGGTKIEGTVPAYDEGGYRYNLEVSFTSDLTMTQLRGMDDETYDTITEELHWAEQDAHEQRREKEWELMQKCDHNHIVEFNEPSPGKGGMIDGYCEDCDKEFLTHG